MKARQLELRVADPEQVARDAVLAVERGVFTYEAPVYAGPGAAEVAALVTRIKLLYGCKIAVPFGGAP